MSKRPASQISEQQPVTKKLKEDYTNYEQAVIAKGHKITRHENLIDHKIIFANGTIRDVVSITLVWHAPGNEATRIPVLTSNSGLLITKLVYI